jgi:hypothetical protein
MDKESVVYPYSKTSFGFKKGILQYVTTWMGLEDITLKKIS